MHDVITLTLNGVSIEVPSGVTVATAVMLAGHACRTSVSGEPRAPLCGMGICFECRVAINGVPHARSCQTRCEAGMDVKTDG